MHSYAKFNCGNCIAKVRADSAYLKAVCIAMLWGVASFGVAKASNPWKFSPRKSYFSPICESFLPQKCPAIRYQS